MLEIHIKFGYTDIPNLSAQILRQVDLEGWPPTSKYKPSFISNQVHVHTSVLILLFRHRVQCLMDSKCILV